MLLRICNCRYFFANYGRTMLYGLCGKFGRDVRRLLWDEHLYICRFQHHELHVLYCFKYSICFSEPHDFQVQLPFQLQHQSHNIVQHCLDNANTFSSLHTTSYRGIYLSSLPHRQYYHPNFNWEIYCYTGYDT